MHACIAVLALVSVFVCVSVFLLVFLCVCVCLIAVAHILTHEKHANEHTHTHWMFGQQSGTGGTCWTIHWEHAVALVLRCGILDAVALRGV